MAWQVGQASANWAKENGLNVQFSNSVPSTNDLAKDEALTLSSQPFKVYFAEMQTQGRGRKQNSWESPPAGTALLSSWSFECDISPKPQWACFVGLALFRALHLTWPTLNLWLKAPNDIHMGDKKIAGLLVEVLQQGDQVRAIVGLGLNVLAGPENQETASYLGSQFAVERKIWPSFLDRLYLEFINSFATPQDQGLFESEKKALLWALNKNPFLSAPYTDFTADGSLVQGQKIIPWDQL